MMAKENNQKLDSLVCCHAEMIKLKMILRENSNEKEAEMLGFSIENVEVALDKLTNFTLDEWIKLSTELISNLDIMTKDLNYQLDGINKNIKNIKKVSNILGSIDKVITNFLKYLE